MPAQTCNRRYVRVHLLLPKPANTGGGRPKKRKATKHKTATKPARPSLTEEQKRELRRVRAAENYQRRKELSLCKDCPAKAIKGQSRCP